jgi:aminotransferase
VREEAIFALEKGATSYTGNAGLLDTRRAISQYLERRYGVAYNPLNEIVVTVGASQAIDITLRAILDPGDECIVVKPSYVCYDPLIQVTRGVPVSLDVRPESGFLPSPHALEALITERTKMLILNYPNNPTGVTYSLPLLREIAEIVERHDLLVISDEIYSELTFEGEEHTAFATLPGMWERTVTISGFSKAFAMTGWRLGYLCGPAGLVSGMLKIHQYAMLCAPIMSQIAAVEALQRLEEDVRPMRESYERRGRLLAAGLRAAGLPAMTPAGAFYAFADIRGTGLDDVTFCERLIEEENVALVPGSAFGNTGKGFVRAAFAVSEKTIERACQRVGAYVERLRE